MVKFCVFAKQEICNSIFLYKCFVTFPDAVFFINKNFKKYWGSYWNRETLGAQIDFHIWISQYSESFSLPVESGYWRVMTDLLSNAPEILGLKFISFSKQRVERFLNSFLEPSKKRTSKGGAVTQSFFRILNVRCTCQNMSVSAEFCKSLKHRNWFAKRGRDC